MDEIVVLDTSFLINIKKLDALKFLCKVFKKVIITNKVWEESSQFQSELKPFNCIMKIELQEEEQIRVNQLHEEFSSIYPGHHYGEIEALVISKSRNFNLLLSDNFAPWYIRKKYLEFETIEIFRGIYYFGRLLELKLIDKDSLSKLEGVYSKKAIRALKERI